MKPLVLIYHLLSPDIVWDALDILCHLQPHNHPTSSYQHRPSAGPETEAQGGGWLAESSRSVGGGTTLPGLVCPTPRPSLDVCSTCRDHHTHAELLGPLPVTPLLSLPTVPVISRLLYVWTPSTESQKQTGHFLPALVNPLMPAAILSCLPGQTPPTPSLGSHRQHGAGAHLATDH